MLEIIKINRFSVNAPPPSRQRREGRGAALLLLFLILLPFLSSCDDYNSFTTDRTATLSFSQDSVRFDTLLTTVPSSTRTLSVYNRGDKGLRITDVWLEGGADSPFRINIDGQDMSRSAANHVTDFEVRRRDSIIVRAEVTLPEFHADEPQAVEDALVFRLESGIEHRIPLAVVGQDAFFMRARIIDKDTTFTARRPIVVYDSLVVARGATLHLQCGTQLYFHEGAGLTVHGRLWAVGTLEQPIVLRGDRTDRMFPYLPYDNLPNRWGGVHLTAEADSCWMEWVDLHSGAYGIRCDSSSLQPLKLRLQCSRIHNLGGHGLELNQCRAEVLNCEISNTLGHCVYQTGGDVIVRHCTLAQFYPLSASRGNALTIASFTTDGAYVPLERADYVNCVITGYADDVIIFPAVRASDDPKLADIDSPVINFCFANSFLATTVPNDEDYLAHFTEVVYDDTQSETRHEKNFRLFDTHNFLYDFTPVEASAIRGIADPAWAQTLPIDLHGHDRNADGAPDAGCYEYLPTP